MDSASDSLELRYALDVEPLTRSQQRLVDALSRLRLEHGMPPTYDELACRLGVGKAVVAEQIRTLENKGYVTHHRYKRRSLELTDPHTGTKVQRDNARLLPLIRAIHAGSAVSARAEVDRYVTVPDHLTGERDAPAFLLRLKDDSMANAHLLRGDVVVVRSSSTAQNGQIVVALAETNEDAEVAAVARYHHSPRRGIELTYETYPEPRPFLPETCRILGVVTGSMRWF